MVPNPKIEKWVNLKIKDDFKNEDNFKNGDNLKKKRGEGFSSQTIFPAPDILKSCKWFGSGQVGQMVIIRLSQLRLG